MVRRIFGTFGIFVVLTMLAAFAANTGIRYINAGKDTIIPGASATTDGTTTFTGIAASTYDIEASAGNVKIDTAGKRLHVKGGANSSLQTVVLTSGEADVANTSVTVNTRIQVSVYDPGSDASHIGQVYTKQVVGAYAVYSTDTLSDAGVRVQLTEEIP